MKKHSCSTESNVRPLNSLLISRFPVLLALFLSVAQTVHAGSATWSSDPGATDPSSWFDAANWTPQTIPNSDADTATFGVDAQTDVSIAHRLNLGGITFDPGASAYSVAFNGGNHQYTLSGAGIVNNSGVVQNFALAADTTGAAFVYFQGHSSAGNSTAFRIAGGSARTTGFVGLLFFFGTSSAGSGTFTFDGGADGWNGGVGTISEDSTLENATLDLGGASATGATGAAVRLFTNASAGNASLVVHGGANGKPGGALTFDNNTSGGTSRVKVLGNGTLDITPHDAPGVTIGSLEGDGTVLIDKRTLSIGSNNLKTKFSGVIQGDGSVTKLGQGTLTLSSNNTYSGPTTVARGMLVVNNTNGSGTGSGPVVVRNGELAGAGIIAGPVSIGVGSAQAILSPGSGKTNLAPLTIQSTLALNASAVYSFVMDSGRGAANQAIANGVTINESAAFSSRDNGNSALAAGTSFVVINNTSAGPIAGRFANLADGSTIVIGPNSYQANYEGGDGNDLVLGVVE